MNHSSTRSEQFVNKIRTRSYLYPAALAFILLMADMGPARAQRWKAYRAELVMGAGLSNTCTDLGGNNKAGGNKLWQQDIPSIRWGASFGYRYRFFKRFSLRPTIALGMLSGDDAYTHGVREDRNLHFRSLVFETSVRAEFFITIDKYGFTVNRENYRGLKSDNIISYVFAGLGLFWFNPRAKLEGVWYDLQPLSTGGQTFSGRGKYRLMSTSYPFGFGVKYALNSRWYIGLEASWHFTSTDYLDDASGKYYELKTIYENISPIAAKLSDRSLEYYGYDVIDQGYENAPVGKKQHTLRGDPANNDSFGFLQFTVSYAIKWGIYN
jgi:hypothetical protein